MYEQWWSQESQNLRNAIPRMRSYVEDLPEEMGWNWNRGLRCDISFTRTRRTAPAQVWPSEFGRRSAFVSRGCTGYVWPPILKAISISASQGITHNTPKPSTSCNDAPGMPEYIALDTSLLKQTIFLVNKWTTMMTRANEGNRKEGKHVYDDVFYARGNLGK